MKKIINGKRYNTETAELVAEFDNGLGRRDFRGYSEELYKTKYGNWFLSVDGGPMTKYSQQCGDMTSGGSDIIALTENEAMEWLESHGENEEIEKHFEDLIKDA